MIRHHPPRDLLEGFAAGEADVALASVLAAHVEQCSTCQALVRRAEDRLAAEAFGPGPSNEDNEANEAAWYALSTRIQPSDRVPATRGDMASDASGLVTIAGQRFELPRAIRCFGTASLKWMRFGRGGQIAKLGRAGKRSLFLIYLAANERVPAHAHEGHEHSYVIAGRYGDGTDTFETGDFSLTTQATTHEPIAISSDGCLLLSSVEHRLNFLVNWPRPLGAVLWWVLNLRARWSAGSP